jgi:hypothetical protein
MFWNEVLIPLAGMATGLLITLSIVKAVSRALERRHESKMAEVGHGAAGDEVESLKGEVSQLRTQMDALEERVDFAERLLTQERNRRQLEQGNREA